MTWYGANLLFVAKALDGEQEIFPVSEEVHLINAPDDETAWKIAKKIGRDDETLEDSSVEGIDEPNLKSTKREFLGIRKLRSIYNPTSTDDIDQSPPTHGSEITRSYFEVIGQDSLNELVNGKPVTVKYLDGAV